MAQLIKSIEGLAIASCKSVEGLAIASVKSIMGLDNTASGGLTFIQDFESSFDGTVSATAATGSFSVQTGDILVALSGSENTSAAGTLTPSGGSLTWTEQKEVTTASRAGADVTTAVAGSNASFAVTITRSLTPGSVGFGGNVMTFRGGSGIGASVKADNTTGTATISITTTQANSAVAVAVFTDTASIVGRTWASVGGATFTELTALIATNSTFPAYGVYIGYYDNVGAIGAKTVGLTAPNGQLYSIVAVEIKGP